MATLSNFRYNSHILLADNDKEFLDFTANMLRDHAYIVTKSDLGSNAMSLLLDEKNNFDLIVMEAQMHGVDGFMLDTIGKKVPLILTSEDPINFAVAKLAIQPRYCFVLQKPFSVEALKNIWLLVLKDQRITYFNWNDELRAKFEAAVSQLGGDNCFPSDVHKLTNEPDCTREQDHSYLQKYRLHNMDVARNKGKAVSKMPTNEVGKKKYREMPALVMPSNITQPFPTLEALNARKTLSDLSPFSPRSGEYFSQLGVDGAVKNTGDEPPNFNDLVPEVNKPFNDMYNFLCQPAEDHLGI